MPVIALAKLGNDAEPFFGTNSTLVTDTTAQTVKAAPADTAQAYFITEVTVTNTTATSTENPLITLEDGADTPVTIDTFVPGQMNSVHRTYSPPRQCTAGKAIKAKADGSYGDCRVTVSGYLATPKAVT